MSSEFAPKAPEQLVAERGKTHGDWMEQSKVSHDLRWRMHSAPGWGNLNYHQREALEMIAVKISRILSGNPAEPDHWLDIQGYAQLGMKGYDK